MRDHHDTMLLFTLLFKWNGFSRPSSSVIRDDQAMRQLNASANSNASTNSGQPGYRISLLQRSIHVPGHTHNANAVVTIDATKESLIITCSQQAMLIGIAYVTVELALLLGCLMELVLLLMKATANFCAMGFNRCI